MTINDLKSRAYDLILTIEIKEAEMNKRIEQMKSEIAPFRQELYQINLKVNELNKKEQEAHLKLAKDVVKSIPKVKG